MSDDAAREDKPLDVTEIAEAAARTSDLKVFGDGDAWQLICKASSEAQGWMKSTKAMEIPGAGCLVQVTTQQRYYDSGGCAHYAVAEAVAFAPGVRVESMLAGTPPVVAGRRLVAIAPIDQQP